jgi:tetratricopeptide (TPR) repeat protein
MDARTRPLNERAMAWVAAGLLFGVALVCYWPALRGGFLWDDDFHVTKPELRSWSGLGRIWTDLHATKQYYPVLHSAFWVEHRLWGDATVGYHWVNLVLHCTSCCLLALLIRRLGPGAPAAPAKAAGAPPGAWSAMAPWLAALVFAVHPVCVETVAWISEQKNTLSLLFYLLAALAYLDFAQGRRRATYCWASLFFVLALLSKSVTATLPAALLVVLWWKNGRIAPRRDVLPLVPWFVAAAADGVFTAWVERTLIGAEGPAFDLSIGQRILLAGHVVWFYLGKLCWPLDLAFTYPRWNVGAEASGWFGYLAALVAVTAALWLARRRFRGPLAAWLIFIGSLFPVLGFVNVYPFVFSYVADHYQYLAGISIVAFASAGAALWLSHRTAPVRLGGWVLAAALVAALAIRTRRECYFYRDSETLYRETLRRNPASWMAHNNLGQILVNEGQVDAAIEHYRLALASYAGFPGTYDDLAVALLKKGQVDEAIVQLRKAAALDPYDAMAHDNLGLALRRKGMIDEALAEFQLALGIRPEDISARFNYAQALLRARRTGEAVAQYGKILESEPENIEARLRLGGVLERLGRTDEALAQFQRAVELRPDNPDAENDLGAALFARGKYAEAAACFQRSLGIRPNSADAHNNLGNAYLRMGRVDAAVEQFKLAVALEPNDPALQRALDVANSLQGSGTAR